MFRRQLFSQYTKTTLAIAISLADPQAINYRLVFLVYKMSVRKALAVAYDSLSAAILGPAMHGFDIYIKTGHV